MGFEPTTASLEGSSCRVSNSDEIGTSEKQPISGVVPGVVTQQNEGGISDPDLARLVAVWPTLPEPIRQGMLNWQSQTEPIRRAILALLETVG
jgi:hypothetical protein